MWHYWRSMGERVDTAADQRNGGRRRRRRRARLRRAIRRDAASAAGGRVTWHRRRHDDVQPGRDQCCGRESTQSSPVQLLQQDTTQRIRQAIQRTVETQHTQQVTASTWPRAGLWQRHLPPRPRLNISWRKPSAVLGNWFRVTNSSRPAPVDTKLYVIHVLCKGPVRPTVFSVTTISRALGPNVIIITMRPCGFVVKINS